MAKTKEQKQIEALDARIRALETHNGWTPGEVHEEPEPGEPEQPEQPEEK